MEDVYPNLNLAILVRMKVDEKKIIQEASKISSISMAGFFRCHALKKAREIIKLNS